MFSYIHSSILANIIECFNHYDSVLHPLEIFEHVLLRSQTFFYGYCNHCYITKITVTNEQWYNSGEKNQPIHQLYQYVFLWFFQHQTTLPLTTWLLYLRYRLVTSTTGAEGDRTKEPHVRSTTTMVSFTHTTTWMFPKIGVFHYKASILRRFSSINHPFWGTTIFRNTYVDLGVFSSSNKSFSSEETCLWYLVPTHSVHKIILISELPFLPKSWFSGKVPEIRGKETMGSTAIFHWTMIVGGRVYAYVYIYIYIIYI